MALLPPASVLAWARLKIVRTARGGAIDRRSWFYHVRRDHGDASSAAVVVPRDDDAKGDTAVERTRARQKKAIA